VTVSGIGNDYHDYSDYHAVGESWRELESYRLSLVQDCSTIFRIFGGRLGRLGRLMIILVAGWQAEYLYLPLPSTTHMKAEGCLSKRLVHVISALLGIGIFNFLLGDHQHWRGHTPPPPKKKKSCVPRALGV
jgi:hypothetical protein